LGVEMMNNEVGKDIKTPMLVPPKLKQKQLDKSILVPFSFIKKNKYIK